MNTNVMNRALSLFAPAILGALTVFFLIGFRYREPPWMQETQVLLLGIELAFAYLVGLILVRSSLLKVDQLAIQVVRIILVGSLVCLPVVVFILLNNFEYRKLTLLIELGAVFFLLLLNGLPISKKVALTINVIVLAIGVQPSLSESSRNSFIELLRGESAEYSEPVNYSFSSLYDIEVTNNQVVPDSVEASSDAGGALALIGYSRLLLADAHGNFYLLTIDEKSVNSLPLNNLKSPMNREIYFNDVARPSRYFRVTDILLEDAGVEGQRTLYVAYHYWDETHKCITLNIDETQLDLKDLNRRPRWQNRFKTTPCLSGARLKNETGGRMALHSPNSLLLTVGISMEGEAFWGMPADDESSYGKIIEINRSDWSSKIFTKGHRNPQGLLVVDDSIWSTEHGPEGGDELNLIVEGGDYGWPTSSYGTDYGKKTLLGSDTPGEHSTGRRPVYAWVPSIGISRLIMMRGTAFPAWRGDLLVGSLAGRGNGHSLFRVRIHEAQVQMIERINTGLRVRDLVEMPNGHLVTWDGGRMVQTIAPASHVFSECSGCHSIHKGWALNGIGPDLWDIVGSPVAAVKGFRYSQSMKNFGGRWSRTRLDEFLRDPQKTIPGTTMSIEGIHDKNKRREIIEFLVNLSR